jgi:hypothetical protein
VDEIKITEPKKEKVVEYEFTFEHKVLYATVYPERGDTVIGHEHGVLFTYPRLKMTQLVYAANLLSSQITESERVYIDVEHAKKLLQQKQEADRKTRERGGQREEVRPQVPRPDLPI